MRIKNLKDEDFIQYKECSMFIGTITCSWKCCIEAKNNICQNSSLANAPIVEIDNKTIVERYLNNPLTSAIVFGGLEPIDQIDELIDFISFFRSKSNDTVIIYTGYNENEIGEQINLLRQFGNIIIKFGRYIPNSPQHFDEVLGVKLASSNQYAKKYE